MSNNFYLRKNSELNLRNELIKTLDGSGPEIAKKKSALLRKMRRDDDGELIPCSCVDPNTNEPDKDYFCAQCYGEGYLWDEIWITMYQKLVFGSQAAPATHLDQKAPGLFDVKTAVMWLRYSETVTKLDKLIEITLEEDGTIPANPLRTRVWRINILEEFRLDNAQIEFFKAWCSQEDIRYLNPPTE